jgi:hypothetical protein
MPWRVVFHPGAVVELDSVPLGERLALDNAIEKLRLFGDQLGATQFLDSGKFGDTPRAATKKRSLSLAGVLSSGWVPIRDPRHRARSVGQSIRIQESGVAGRQSIPDFSY